MNYSDWVLPGELSGAHRHMAPRQFQLELGIISYPTMLLEEVHDKKLVIDHRSLNFVRDEFCLRFIEIKPLWIDIVTL